MKYIVVKGNNKTGKPYTFKEACGILEPPAIYEVTCTEAGEILIDVIQAAGFMDGGTYIVEVGPKKLLLVQNSPAQPLPIKRIIDRLQELDMI